MQSKCFSVSRPLAMPTESSPYGTKRRPLTAYNVGGTSGMAKTKDVKSRRGKMVEKDSRKSPFKGYINCIN